MTTPYVSAFLAGMHDHGYMEGQGFDITLRFADDDYSRLTALAQELVSLNPDVIVPIEPVAAGAVKHATSTIPIVAPLLVDPINLGLIESYARPGGNVTGISISVQGLRGKLVEITRELVPKVATIGILFNPTNPGNLASREDIEAAGAASGVAIVVVGVAGKIDLDPAFHALTAAQVEGVIVLGDAMLVGERARIAGLAAAAHLTTLSNTRAFVEAGCLLSYGVNLQRNERRAAYFVDKILKGAKPADLPVEVPTKLELVVNLQTAKALGFVVPTSILLRADEVIE